MSQPPSDAKRTGSTRAPSGDVTGMPKRGLAGVRASASCVSDQNAKKSSGRVRGGRVARTVVESG